MHILVCDALNLMSVQCRFELGWDGGERGVGGYAGFGPWTLVVYLIFTYFRIKEGKNLPGLISLLQSCVEIETGKSGDSESGFRKIAIRDVRHVTRSCLELRSLVHRRDSQEFQGIQYSVQTYNMHMKEISRMVET